MVYLRLENKVIDIEVANYTPSPTVDPSVRVILVGHSMGGIVAAETLLSIARDTPVPFQKSSTPPPGVGNSTTTTTAPSSPHRKSTNLNPPQADAEERASSAPPQSRSAPVSDPDEGTSDPIINDGLLFPYVQAILAFDTPYLGIHPGVVAHGAETHYNTASAAYNAYQTATKLFGTGGGSGTATPSPSAGALPTAESAGGWGKWGKYAMFAGGAAAVAAAGAGIWSNKDQISQGWSWAFSHLEFVGCLARNAELTQRVAAVVRMEEKHGIGFADFYTALGNDKIGKTKYSAQFLGEQRTFCVVPDKAKSTITKRSDSPSPNKKRKTQEPSEADMKKAGKNKGTWIKCTNAKATSEVSAHTGIFTPAENPDYFAMSEKARNSITKWIDRPWYESSNEDEKVELPEDVMAGTEEVSADSKIEEGDSKSGAEKEVGKDEL